VTTVQKKGDATQPHATPSHRPRPNRACHKVHDEYDPIVVHAVLARHALSRRTNGWMVDRLYEKRRGEGCESEKHEKGGTDSLVEQSESHVVVGLCKKGNGRVGGTTISTLSHLIAQPRNRTRELTLLGLLLLLLGSGLGGTTGSGGSTGRSGGGGSARRDRGELGRTLGDQLRGGRARKAQ